MKLDFISCWKVVLLTMLCSSAPGRAQVAPSKQVGSLSSPFGLNASAWSHLGANTDRFDVSQGERRLALLKETGARWDRVDFWWHRIEPRQGEFLWRDYDRIVDKYAREGVSLMPILAYSSAWSKGAAPATEAERARYGRFVHNTVARYRNRVKVWEIWNEPNIGDFWSPIPNARDYAALLQVAYREAKRADPSCIVVGGVTAGIDYGFIEDLLELGGGRFMDALSIHPYQGNLGSVGPEEGGLFNSIGSLQKLLAHHQVRLPIHITEMGHTTRPGGKVSEDEQANYLVRSYALALAAGVQRLFWFNLHDWEEHWGLVRLDYSKKPSFTAYRTMTRALANKKPAALLEFGGGARGVLFSRDGSTANGSNRVAVVWATGDVRPVTLNGQRAYDIMGAPLDAKVVSVGRRAVFVEQPRLNQGQLRPLPTAPAFGTSRRRTPEPPPLPAKAPWTERLFSRRILVTLSAAERTAGTPINVRVPGAARDARVVKLDGVGRVLGRVPAQMDEQNGAVMWMLPPNARPHEPLFYAVYWQLSGTEHISVDGAQTLRATPDRVENQLLRLETPGGKYIARVVHKSTGWVNEGAEVSGLFAASYNDSADGWPRLGQDAELVKTWRQSGPVFARVTSHVRFGRDKPDYRWSVTLYHNSGRIDWTGEWLNRGAGARKFVHLGTSFPSGTRVRGRYSTATLPQVGASYGKWALVPAIAGQPSEVAMVLVAPGRNLGTPGWSQHAVIGVGSFYENATPVRLAATMFVLPSRVTTESEAERLYRELAFSQRARVGVIEQHTGAGAARRLSDRPADPNH